MGRLDVLLRSLEDEHRDRLLGDQARSMDSIIYFNNQTVLSELFISGIYSILRALHQRTEELKRMAGDVSSINLSLNDLEQLYRDFELIRVPLDKFELWQDRKIKEPVTMFKLPQTNEVSDIHVYDPKDWQRSTILTTGFSQTTGSVAWFVSDNQMPKWLYRRDLSDAFLEFAQRRPGAIR